MTTGLVLVGGAQLASSQSERGVRAIQDSYERLRAIEALNAEKDATIGVATGRISAVEIQIVLRAYDEASAVLRQAKDGTASLGRSIERSLERWSQAFLASQRNREDLRSRGYRVGRNVDGSFYTGPPYIVGEHGPELFTPHTPIGKPRTDIDYESLARAISKALAQMPPPRIVQ